jgi:hypothetical protein
MNIKLSRISALILVISLVLIALAIFWVRQQQAGLAAPAVGLFVIAPVVVVTVAVLFSMFLIAVIRHIKSGSEPSDGATNKELIVTLAIFLLIPVLFFALKLFLNYAQK